MDRPFIWRPYKDHVRKLMSTLTDAVSTSARYVRCGIPVQTDLVVGSSVPIHPFHAK